MQNRLNAALVFSLFGLFSVATACGDDTGSNSPGNGEAGESGAPTGSSGAMSSSGGGETNGNAGSPSGNGGDPSSNGGSPSVNGGNPAVNGGNPAVNGGEPSVNGGNPAVNGGSPSNNGGNGGDPSGSGGDPSGSGGAAAGAGGSGPVACIPITLSQFQGGGVEPTFATYTATFTPNIVGLGGDALLFDVYGPPQYDGDETGTFDLTENGDDNFATCSRCFRVIADTAGTSTVFYPSEGTLEIDAASTQLTGTIDATVSNLKLVEVTISGGDATSTPVPNGRCLTVASADIVVQGIVVPEGWVCPVDYLDDGFCDCGCGAKDPGCTSTTNEGECDYCTECTASITPCNTDLVDPADTTMCL